MGGRRSEYPLDVYKLGAGCFRLSVALAFFIHVLTRSHRVRYQRRGGRASSLAASSSSPIGRNGRRW